MNDRAPAQEMETLEVERGALVGTVRDLRDEAGV